MKGDLLYKTIDLFLYSHFFIALCAASLAYQTFHVFGVPVGSQPLSIFIFFATLLVYSGHRIVGFSKLDRTIPTRRISIILDRQKDIIGYTAFAALGMVGTCFFLQQETLILLSLPALLSIFYIIPLFGRGRRFRDLPFIKVFVVSITWIWVCVYVPTYELRVPLHASTTILLCEKLLFIIAITIPFDIRDLEIDALHHVKTIPGTFGVKQSKRFCTALLLGSIISTAWLYGLGFYNCRIFLALLISYVTTLIIIQQLRKEAHDYWYSGILDSTILLQFVLVILFSS